MRAPRTGRLGAELARFRIIDRYIRGQLLGWYGACIGVIVPLLWVESIPRLLAEVRDANLKALIVVRSLTSLTPEYVADAMPLALYLATAIVIRRLALNGELEALASSGLSDFRLLRQPILLALFSACAVIGLRGFLQPAGERELVAIGRSVQAGEFGYGLEPGIAHRLSPTTTLFFGRIGESNNEIEDVAVQSGSSTFIATSATIGFSGPRTWKFRLRQGTMIIERDGRTESARFDWLTLAGPDSSLQPRRTPLHDQLAELDLWGLLRLTDGQQGLTAASATSAAWSRIAAACLCLMLPLLAFAQAIPPKRGRSAIGFGLGIVEIIAFWKLSAWIEDSWTDRPGIGHCLIVAIYAFAALLLLRFQARNGFGAVERELLNLALKSFALLRSLPVFLLSRSVPRRRPADTQAMQSAGPVWLGEPDEPSAHSDSRINERNGAQRITTPSHKSRALGCRMC